MIEAWLLIAENRSQKALDNGEFNDLRRKGQALKTG